MRNALSIHDVRKAYRLVHNQAGADKYAKLSDALANGVKSFLSFGSGASRRAVSSEIFWALEGVSFSATQGERIGIIGRNGAGKSTLLKIISRITAPTSGRIEIAGRVSSLLEVGTGFHPELTGRENIFLNGSVLGMTRRDIRNRFDEIVEFAEVERFLDTPVKRYSSGMYMRLAFAVAAHLEPDILIVDEVLAVGDAAFQKKCLSKMKDVGREGRTVLFVSHNMGAISEFCDRAILLDNGTVKADGSPSDVISLYNEAGTTAGLSSVFDFPDQGKEPCHINRVAFLNSDHAAVEAFEVDEEITLEIDYTVREILSELQLSITVRKDAFDLFHGFDNDGEPDIVPTAAGIYRASYKIPPWRLKEGHYSVRITAGIPTALIHDINRDLSFEIRNSRLNALKKSFRADRTGMVISPGTWQRTILSNLPKAM